MSKSVSTRYFYSTSFLLLCSITLMGLIQFYLSMGYFQEEKNTALIGTIDNAVRIFHDYQADGDDIKNDIAIVNVSREILITARASGNLIFVTDPYGTTLLCNDSGLSASYLAKQFPARALNEAYQQGVYTELGTLGGFFKARYYLAGKPLVTGDDKLAGFIFAASDASGLAIYLSNMFSTFILSAGLMLMISSVLSIWMTARMTTPLRRMADAASRFGKGDFSVRVPEEGDDEVLQLSHSFNAMAESLEKIDSSRTSFMGNIAHELRTPMTTIKGFVDGILDGTIPPESHEHYLGIVSQEAGRLTRLIKNMLDITKLEAGEYKVNARTYDVWESLTGVVFGAEQRIEANHIHLSGFAPTRTLVYADPDLVYQVIYNLFDNALKFCGDGGEIHF
ncbi:MAG: HAMP domain-containing sensor histidine kinase, partial [Ruthenibacterium sp.]